jgi:hypothetical protein
MTALSHTTSSIFPRRCNAWYTPGLHGRPSTILIGAHNPGSTVGLCLNRVMHFVSSPTHSWDAGRKNHVLLCKVSLTSHCFFHEEG